MSTGGGFIGGGVFGNGGPGAGTSGGIGSGGTGSMGGGMGCFNNDGVLFGDAILGMYEAVQLLSNCYTTSDISIILNDINDQFSSVNVYTQISGSPPEGAVPFEWHFMTNLIASFSYADIGTIDELLGFLDSYDCNGDFGSTNSQGLSTACQTALDNFYESYDINPDALEKQTLIEINSALYLEQLGGFDCTDQSVVDEIACNIVVSSYSAFLTTLPQIHSEVSTDDIQNVLDNHCSNSTGSDLVSSLFDSMNELIGVEVEEVSQVTGNYLSTDKELCPEFLNVTDDITDSTFETAGIKNMRIKLELSGTNFLSVKIENIFFRLEKQGGNCQDSDGIISVAINSAISDINAITKSYVSKEELQNANANISMQFQEILNNQLDNLISGCSPDFSQDSASVLFTNDRLYYLTTFGTLWRNLILHLNEYCD